MTALGWIEVIIATIILGLGMAVHLVVVASWCARTDEKVQRLFDRTDHIFPQHQKMAQDVHNLTVRFARLETIIEERSKE